jgi:hypothetical protein
VATAGLAAVALSACATVPDSGPAQAGKVAVNAGGPGQDYAQLVPIPPRPGWTPKQIVSGFLAACAGFAGNHAVARQYLDPAVRHSWNPGWAVTVVGAPPTVGRPVVSPHWAGVGTPVDQVTATGEKLATLTSNGQYVGAQGSSSYQFQLSKVRGQWRIQNPPSQLLLNELDFKRVYAPRNLYFLAGTSGALVPDPVFVPLEASNVDLANKLVSALLNLPQGWLATAVTTAFPGGTARLGPVTLDNGTATINLGGSAAAASGPVLSQMTAQLAWTLTGPSYGQSGIQTVDLEINGHLRRSASLPVGRGGLSVPLPAPNAPLYAANASGVVQKLTGSQPPQTVPGAAGQGKVHLDTIAVSPGGRYVAGLTPSGRTVYYAALARNARLSAWSPGGSGFTSLSWDPSGGLWVASPDGVWLLHPGGTPVPLGLSLPPGSVVSQLRVAPDGVRIAMIVRSPAWGTRIMLAAIEHVPHGDVVLGSTVTAGDDVPNPTQLAWYDADTLLVLSQTRGNAQLHSVPVNGSSAKLLDTASGTVSISSAGPANPLAAGLPNGQMALTTSLNGTWVTQPEVVLSPVYPG